MTRLLDSGLVTHLMDDVIRTYLVKDAQRKKTLVNADRSLAANSVLYLFLCFEYYSISNILE